MYTVLITTSGTGSRLLNHTKYTNKSLVKLGDKLAICYIIEQYNLDTEYIITIGHYGNFVKDFLLLAYPTRSFIFIEVDKFEGPGSSLGYSMLKAKEYLQKPFIFHCCDTILQEKLSIGNTNTLIVSKNNDYNSYSTIIVSGNNVICLNKKGEPKNDYIYIGISYFKDYDIFWNMLESSYLANPSDTSLSDIHSIQKMIQTSCHFTYSVVSTHCDTGNIKSYNESKIKFKSNYDILEKDNESLCFFDSNVIKFFHDKDVSDKRILRGKSLYPLCPKILNYKSNFFSMELVKGTVLSEYYSYGEINKLLEWAKLQLWINIKKNDTFKNISHAFYYTKTIDRIKKLPFITNEYNIVNGLLTGSVFDIINNINFNLLSTNEFSQFHGDFILDNIIKKENGDYSIIDWRHEFGTELYYGDMYYDLAKLKHNIIFNHKNITNQLFSIKEEGTKVIVDLKCNYFLIKQLDDFNKFIEKNSYNSNKINILMSLIWLNMAPLYEEPLSKFLFYFGKFNLFIHTSQLSHTHLQDEQHPIVH
jgi:choline kinase